MVTPSFNQLVPWYEILNVLQVPFHSKALPIMLSCPLCGRTALHLFNDNICGGAWHYCVSCKSSGDMLTLTSKVMQLSPAATLMALSRNGLSIPPDMLNVYSAQEMTVQAERQNRFHDMWKQAQDYYRKVNSSALSHLRHKYGLFSDMSIDRWREGPGRLLGALPAKVVQNYFYPEREMNSVRHPDSPYPRVFKGMKWTDVLMTPFYDLPGRITGFGFIGRNGFFPQDFVYKEVNRISSSKREAGLAFWPSVEMSGNARNIIAVDDWSMALRLHIRHFRTSMSALPMVAWYDNGKLATRHAWTMLSQHRIIFWSLKMNYQMLMQAIETDGMIANCGPRGFDWIAMREYLSITNTTQMHKLIVKEAKPWAQALMNWMKYADENEVDVLMQALDQAGADVSYILKQCGRSRGVKQASLNCRTIVANGKRIIEQNNCWMSSRADKWSKLRQTEVCNFVLRMTHLIKDKESGELYYRGFVRFRDKEIPFIETMEEVKTQTASFVERLLLESNAGVAIFDERYKQLLYQYAVLFHEPVMVVDDLWKWVKKLNASRGKHGYFTQCDSPEPAMHLLEGPVRTCESAAGDVGSTAPDPGRADGERSDRPPASP